MPTVPLADQRCRRVDSVPVSRLTVATPSPIADVGGDVVDGEAGAGIDQARARRADGAADHRRRRRAAHLDIDVGRAVQRQALRGERRVVRKANGTSPEKSSNERGRARVVNGAAALEAEAGPSPMLALKVSRLAGKRSGRLMLMRTEAGAARLRRWTPAASTSKATAGLAGAPETLTVPEIEPAAPRPGEKVLASDAGTAPASR